MLITLISLNKMMKNVNKVNIVFDLTTLARPRSRMTIREEGLIVKGQVLLCYVKGKRCLFVIVKILKDRSNDFLCTVQNKNGEKYVKKWFRKLGYNLQLRRPTFKEVEKDWKENRESFMYPNVKALY